MEAINSTVETVLNRTLSTVKIILHDPVTSSLITTNGNNNSGNYTSILKNYSLSEAIESASDDGHRVCKDGLFLPFWEHDARTDLIVFHGLVYFFALIYTFVGVAIIADRFMLAIEQITGQETDVIVRKPNGEKEIMTVRIWNETVSNLTLMALGSSAPEILLSVIEVYAQNFEAGELGPGTIVGSAAFNMLIIIAICVWCVPSDTVKKIKHLRVFCITMAFSVFAYVWMLFILVWSTPGVIEVWEGLLTFTFFPITVLIAYIADRRLLIYKYLDKRYRMKSGRKVVYGGADSADGENLELTSVETNGVKIKVNDVEIKGDAKYIDASEEDIRKIDEQRDEVIEILRNVKNRNPGASNEELEKLARSELVKLQPKSRAYYRIQAARKILGTVTEKVKVHFIKSINEDFEDETEAEEDCVKVFFNPKEYTVMENVGTFTLTISRSEDLESTILVEYNTEDGTAKAGSDYKQTKGIISFGPGESHKQINIEVINDDVYEEDEYFYVRLSNARYLSVPSDDEDKRPAIRITEPDAKVNILDDDHSGVFSFFNNVVQVPESVGEYHLRVTRFCGARGQVSLPYKTIAGSAKPGRDFVMAEGKIIFDDNEANKDIPITIINNDNYEKNAIFYVEIEEPIRDDYSPSVETDKGAPRLGDITKCMIRIRESRDFKATVDKLMRKSRAVSAISTSSWEEQFIDAVKVPKLGADLEEEEEEVDTDARVQVVEKKSIFAYIIHYLTLFWKILFACVPPPSIYNGWPCFVVSIIVIGLLTALINDLASHFGCTVGLKDSVTAISLVALGTSVPDTFASKIAAMNDKYADSSIGNVTGSNAVNVFLGIGIAWTMAAIYHAFNKTEFKVPPGNLSYSVTIFVITAFICAAVLLLRRSRTVGGELGGPMIYKLPTTLLFVALWIFYLVMSSLEAYGIVKGF